MSFRRSTVLLLVLIAMLATSEFGHAAVPGEIVVSQMRIHVGDLVPDADPTTAAVDLGPSPAAGVSRLITRADIVAALQAKEIASPRRLPDAIRVVRKVRHLAPSDIENIVRTAIAAKHLGRGVTLAAVRSSRPVDVADGFTRVDVDLPRAPKRAGTFSTTGIVSLFVGDEVVARLPVPLDLAVSEEGAAFDAPRGASVTLVLRRNLIEVRVPGFLTADGDVGDAVPVQLRPSGRVLRARLTSKDEAVVLEGQ